MTSEPANTQPSPSESPETRRRRRAAIAWRLAAVALVVLAMVAAAHFLRTPAGFQGGEWPDNAWHPAANAGGGPDVAPPKDTEPGDRTNDLRKLMAGLIISAIEDDGDYQDPRNATPDARRKFVAKHFGGLPPDYPRSAAPPDAAPKDAVIMAVVPNPGAPGARMVLVRIRKEIPQVLADFQKLYVTAGWVCDGPPDPKAQPDEGWLMRFSKGNRERVIYARPRRLVGETLVAIYDSPL
jgi:hypothetical protein